MNINTIFKQKIKIEPKLCKTDAKINLNYPRHNKQRNRTKK